MKAGGGARGTVVQRGVPAGHDEFAVAGGVFPPLGGGFTVAFFDDHPSGAHGAADLLNAPGGVW